jgi:hypothetical protein
MGDAHYWILMGLVLLIVLVVFFGMFYKKNDGHHHHHHHKEGYGGLDSSMVNVVGGLGGPIDNLKESMADYGEDYW